MISVSAFPQCSISITTSVTNVTCYNGTTGAVTITATGGTAPYQYQLAVGGAGAWSSNNVFTGLAAGSYPASVKDATGCIGTVYFTVTQPAALTVGYTAADPTCSSSTNGSISTFVTGGTLPYSYSWTKDGSAYSSSSNLTGLGSGNYLLVVTDAAGCTTSPVVTQQIRAITLSGFNEDVIANGAVTNITTVSSQSLDAGPGYVLYATGLTGGTKGLPSSGSFTSAQSASRPYQLASYSTSNALLLRSSGDNLYGGATSGTLSFATQYRGPYSTLYVIGTTGSGTGTINYTVNYSDASTSTGTLTFQDWFLSYSSSSGFRALGNLGRVSRTNPGTVDNTGDFNLWEAPISIPGASQSKTINSVMFTWAGSSTARTSIFAITGYTSTSSGIRINDGPTSSVTPSVSIVSNAASNQFCSGQSVTFTATPTNGGNTPSYQWKLNGSNVGTNSATYTNNSLANNNQVSVVMTASGGVSCLTTPTATSNTITMTLATKTASVSVAASSANICTGSNAAFTATPTNGGTVPSYQWKLNGNNVGSNSATYSNNSLSNNDQVRVVMTSNIGCATNNPATSNTITMAVSNYVTPSVSISSAPAHPGVSFSSSINGGGASPSYQWYKNGSVISSATASTYYASAPALGDKFSLQLTSNAACPTAPAAMSNYITVTYTVLPLTLEWYKLHVQNNHVVMEWKTSGEINADTFVIERSEQAAPNFLNVGTVAASNTPGCHTYSFTDAAVLSGTYIYRLTELDIDGHKKILGSLIANLNQDSWWIIKNLSSSWVIQSGNKVNYDLYDMQGRLLEKGICNGEKVISKEGRNFVCILQLQTNDKVITNKLLP